MGFTSYRDENVHMVHVDRKLLSFYCTLFLFFFVSVFILVARVVTIKSAQQIYVSYVSVCVMLQKIRMTEVLRFIYFSLFPLFTLFFTG